MESLHEHPLGRQHVVDLAARGNGRLRVLIEQRRPVGMAREQVGTLVTSDWTNALLPDDSTNDVCPIEWPVVAIEVRPGTISLPDHTA